MNVKILVIVVSIALGAAISPNAVAVTCAKVKDVIERADLIFTAVPTHVTREPPSVEIPRIALHQFELPENATENIPHDYEFEITSCSPECRTWRGTVKDLPATVVDPWYEIELSVQNVWRGPRSPGRVVYATRELQLGDEYLFALTVREGEHMMFGGPCSWGVSVFHGSRLEELGALLGNPVYRSN